MTDPPIVGKRRHPPKEGEPDGVVLFDPAPPPPLELPLDEAPAPRFRGLSILLLVLLASVAGGYVVYGRVAQRTADSVALPVAPPIDPAAAEETLTAVGGGIIDGEAGSSIPLSVRAAGPGGVPISDTVVTFRVAQGGGLLQIDAARTDTEGVARAVLLLPRRAGMVIVEAELTGTDARTSIAVDARAGMPARMVPTDGDQQTAEVGELLPTRLSVTVLDGDGNPVPGSEIRFEVLSGGGISAPTRARTDSLGQAAALWRLGPEPGAQQLAAASTVLGSAVTFTATARGRPRAGDGTPLPVEAGPVSVRSVDFVVGGSHVCYMTGAGTTCRGANDRGQIGTGTLAGFRALAAGISHMCGLDEIGIAMCWGANEGGQLGDGSHTDRASPVPVRSELRFSSLTAGASHTCGLAGGGIPLCWGQNLSGQLGDGSRTDARFPRAVGGGMTFTTLVAGWNHTCGLTGNGNAFCWGLNGDGQLGDGSRLDRLVPTLARGAMESLAAGSAHTCGISRGEVLCWGDNRFGQVGDGSTEGRQQPVAVAGLPGRPTQVTVGAVHSCALLSDGAAYCWGQNLQGQLGDGTTANRTSAVAVTGGLRFRALHAGGALTCGVAMDGAQYCWGLNQSGQLGDGTRESRRAPTRVRG